MARSDASRAAAVTRALRAGGVTVLPSGTPRSREGVRVTGGALGATAVCVDIDTPSLKGRVVEDVREALTAAGYAITANQHDPAILYAERSAATAAQEG